MKTDEQEQFKVFDVGDKMLALLNWMEVSKIFNIVDFTFSVVGSIWIFVSGFIVGGGIGLCVLGNSVVDSFSVYWVVGSSGTVSINSPSVVSIIIVHKMEITDNVDAAIIATFAKWFERSAE